MTLNDRNLLFRSIPCSVEIRKWGRVEFETYNLIRRRSKTLDTDKGILKIGDIATIQNIMPKEKGRSKYETNSQQRNIDRT